jgi:para-aminobenzoate synthetase/4-amino-4-deoxychorismate lyase
MESEYDNVSHTDWKTGSAPSARFFDLRISPGDTFRLVDPVATFETQKLADVTTALDNAEAAARAGFWVAGFLAYEAAPAFDSSLLVKSRLAGDPFSQLPLAWFTVFRYREDGPFEEDHQGLLGTTAPDQATRNWQPSVSEACYKDSVKQLRELIGSGDTYQANYTFRLRATLEEDERLLHDNLLLAQRGGYGAYINLGRYRILSASPELFFQTDGTKITVRPMKGTAGRGRWWEEDENRRIGLLSSTKELAENVMIVDLLRNDLGRIANMGSVEVRQLFEAERYETVWQLTSTITAELPRNTGLQKVFRALFPSGSITGAPKIRTMEVLAGLEDSPRGIYTGTIGFIKPGGDAVFNVAIRTAVVDNISRTAEYGVGGGITWASSASAEYDEAMLKAAPLWHKRPQFELIETLRYVPDQGFFLLDRHLARLRCSADYFNFTFDEELVVSVLKQAVAFNKSGALRIRLTLNRLGHAHTMLTPLPPPQAGPTLVALDYVPIDAADVLRYHKTSDRRSYRDASLRHQYADDVLLVNSNNELVESTIANVAVKLDGRWWTPPLDSGCLPGVFRAALIDSALIAERPITISNLRECESLALINSVRLCRPALLMEAPTHASREIAGVRPSTSDSSDHCDLSMQVVDSYESTCSNKSSFCSTTMA